MDSLGDILAQKDFAEPSVIEAIKSYIKNKYDSNVNVRLANDKIIITTPSAALASSLQSNLMELKKATNMQKKLVIRIG